LADIVIGSLGLWNQVIPDIGGDVNEKNAKR
jgi:hypothetical protein